MSGKEKFNIDSEAVTSKLVEIEFIEPCDECPGFCWDEGPFAGIAHAEEYLRSMRPHSADCFIRPYITHGSIRELFEVFYNQKMQTVQFFDIARQPIPWLGRDDKRRMSVQELHNLLDFLRTFGINFQSLWDIDAHEYWIHTRKYEDGREKFVNRRYFGKRHRRDAFRKIQKRIDDNRPTYFEETEDVGDY